MGTVWFSQLLDSQSQDKCYIWDFENQNAANYISMKMRNMHPKTSITLLSEYTLIGFELTTSKKRLKVKKTTT